MFGAASLLAIVVASETPVATAADPTMRSSAAATPSLQLTPAAMFELAELADSKGDAQTVTAVYQALEKDPDPDIRAEARFRHAMRLVRLDRARDAAILFRRLLDEKPAAALVRVQLATILHKLGDEEAALRQLRAVRSASLPPSVARFVDRLSASLQASKPLSFNFELALAPDSNINRSTRSDTLGTIFGDFTLDQDSKEKSGVGAAVRGLAQARLSLGANLDLTARAGADTNLYRDKDFNDISLDLSAGPEWRIGRTRLTAEAGAGQHWYGMKPYQRSLRIGGSLTRPIGPVAQARIDVAARWTDNRVNDLQDGSGLSMRLRYERALSPRMLLSGFIGADRFKARDDAYSTKSWSAGMTAYREMGRMTLFAGVELGRLKADARLALLPEARKDQLRRIQLGAVYRQFTFAGFAPMTRLVVERNRSSVEFYDYQRTRTEFGVSRAF